LPTVFHEEMAEDEREDFCLSLGRYRPDQGRMTHGVNIPEVIDSSKLARPGFAENRYTNWEGMRD